jgi:hypothetical protein
MLHRSKCLLPLENERHAPNARAPVAAAERAAETKKSDHGLELPIAIMLTPCSGCRMLSTSALVWLRASQTNQQDASNRETSYAYPITEDATPEWLHLPRSPTIWVIWHSICGPHPHLSCQILTDGIPVKSTPPDHRALLSITVTRSRSNLLMVLRLLSTFTLEMRTCVRCTTKPSNEPTALPVVCFTSLDTPSKLAMQHKAETKQRTPIASRETY